VGGLIDGSGVIHLGLSIPSLDSLLVGYSAGTVVPGLSSVAADARPSIVEANIAHLAFDLMVGLGTAGALLAVWYLWVLLRHRRLPDSVWFYRLAALAGVGCYAAVEAGWVTTEVGRQPWIVYGLMRVSDAVTGAPASFVWTMLATLVVVYALIAYFFIYLLVRLAARWRRDDALGPSAPEEGAPYGPRPRSFGKASP
jgi:cytochrome d ubiquinol oxidase subunit I